MAELNPQQGEIYLADLNPIKGSEQAGKRPVLIISGNTLNANMPITIVCPLSTKLKHYSTCAVLKADSKNGLKKDSEIITFQIRTISKKRLLKRLGIVDDETLRDIIKKLNYLLIY